MSLVKLLTAQKVARGEQQTSVPDQDGSSPIALSIDGADLSACNLKAADWKQILNKATDFEGSLKQQFGALKRWLESDWRANAKNAEPPATQAEPPAKKARVASAAASHRLCPRPRAGATSSSPDAAGASSGAVAAGAIFDALTPGAVSAFARQVASHLRTPDARALQNGGVGDQLPKALDDKLRRIEDNQGRLIELAVAEYSKENAASVRAAAVKKYAKAHKHDPGFVAAARTAYAQAREGAIIDAAAAKYMEEHKDEEDFREEAVDAYVVKYSECEELKDAAAEKYKEEHEEDDDFIAAAQQKYVDENQEEVEEAAAEKYMEEHKSDEDFIGMAARLRAEEM